VGKLSSFLRKKKPSAILGIGESLMLCWEARFGVLECLRIIILLAIFQIIEINAKRGRFLFVPHGPVFFKR